MCEYMSNFILLYIQHTLMGPNNITTNKLKMTTYTCLFLVPDVTTQVQVVIFIIIVFRLVRDVVANHKTTRYAGAATKVIQKNHLA